ncbi:MAG: MBL fold metallo-hydrolase [Oscillospiraceae bacterium]|nr:MBL fold metallo-hydrolase [Oscillospiraceae bacterium]
MADKKRSIANRRLLAVLAAIALFIFISFLPRCMGRADWRELAHPAAVSPPEQIRVHFIDVGQGDSILIQAQGEAMLIDGGERGQEDTVLRYLRGENIRELRYVVATHPDSDHIGGLTYGILEALPVAEIIAPHTPQTELRISSTYKVFLELVTKMKQEGTRATAAEPGAVFALGEASFIILGPTAASAKSNNNSVAFLLDYRDFELLLTGDAETEEETALVARWGAALDCDLMKAGHHGSRTSNTTALLELATPEAVAISCGAGNRYGHPHKDVLDRLAAMQIDVYRTDLEKEPLVFASDGMRFWREAAA